MIGTIRLFWAATVILAASATLAPLQWLAMKTRLAPEPWFRTAWHRAVLKALGIRVHRLGELESPPSSISSSAPIPKSTSCC